MESRLLLSLLSRVQIHNLIEMILSTVGKPIQITLSDTQVFLLPGRHVACRNTLHEANMSLEHNLNSLAQCSNPNFLKQDLADS
jgi:hypothetical protein